MNRSEHVEWAKKRAIEYVDQGDLTSAIASMTSDLGKHPETVNHPGLPLILMEAMGGRQLRADSVRRWIDGFR
jgi:hypothetical protein